MIYSYNFIECPLIPPPLKVRGLLGRNIICGSVRERCQATALLPQSLRRLTKSDFKPYGEVKSIEKLPYMEIKTMGEGFLNRRSRVPNKKHLTAARRTWEECLREIKHPFKKGIKARKGIEF